MNLSPGFGALLQLGEATFWNLAFNESSVKYMLSVIDVLPSFGSEQREKGDGHGSRGKIFFEVFFYPEKIKS